MHLIKAWNVEHILSLLYSYSKMSSTAQGVKGWGWIWALRRTNWLPLTLRLALERRFQRHRLCISYWQGCFVL